MESQGARFIAVERERQWQEEGWTADHDDHHTLMELSRTGASFALTAVACEIDKSEDRNHVDYGRHLDWPWGYSMHRPYEDPIRSLTKAGALIAAEIDRLLRLREAE